MRIYEHAAKKLEFRLPPPPEPRGWEFAELLPTPNSGFEKGDESDWQSAWGGARAFTAVAGADYKPEKFSGDARRPHDGAFCGIIAAEGKEARDLIRRSFSWPHTVGKGLFHARVWVASSDNADQLKHPLRVRLCVSDHGSVDAGNVAWSRAVISPGKWTLLQCRPEVPKTRNLTAFLLIEGGGQGEESYLKIDDLEIVVDEK